MKNHPAEAVTKPGAKLNESDFIFGFIYVYLIFAATIKPTA